MAGTIINDLVESMQTRRNAVVYRDKSEVFNIFMHPTLNSSCEMMTLRTCTSYFLSLTGDCMNATIERMCM